MAVGNLARSGIKIPVVNPLSSSPSSGRCTAVELISALLMKSDSGDVLGLRDNQVRF